MTYRVRSPDGELDFASLYDVANAMRQGLVDGDDELFSPGQPTPVRIAEHPALKGHLPKPSRPMLAGGVGRFELGATVAAGLAAITGILSGWNHWVVGGCILAVAWLSTRIAVRAARRRSTRR